MVRTGLIFAGVAAVSTSGASDILTSHVRAADAGVWRGASVALTSRKPSKIVVPTRGEVFGYAASVVLPPYDARTRYSTLGDELVKEDGIEDAKPYVGQELLKAVTSAYGAVAATTPPIQTDETDPYKLASAAVGADLLLDVRGGNSSIIGWSTKRAHVGFGVAVTLIDVRAQKTIAQGDCQATDREDGPTAKDKLLSNQAAVLKARLKLLADRCIADLASKVLKIVPVP